MTPHPTPWDRAARLVDGERITQTVGTKHECPGGAAVLIEKEIIAAIAADRERTRRVLTDLIVGEWGMHPDSVDVAMTRLGAS